MAKTNSVSATERINEAVAVIEKRGYSDGYVTRLIAYRALLKVGTSPADAAALAWKAQRTANNREANRSLMS